MEIYEKGRGAKGLLSIDSKALEDRLRQVAVGETISYRELSEVIHRDVQNQARHLLATARERLLRKEQVLFGVIRDEGLKRLNDSQKVRTGAPRIEHIHRTAKKAIREVSSADFDALSPADKVNGNTYLSGLGAVALFTHPKSINRIEAEARSRALEIPTAAVLDLFRKKGKKSR